MASNGGVPVLLLISCFTFFLFFPFAASTVGINYGRVADNLPPPEKVVELLKSNGITMVKLFDSDPSVLTALSGSGIGVVVGLPNEDLISAAAGPGFAASWVRTNVAAYLPGTRITGIAIGNEVFASDADGNLTSSLVPAMRNVHAALSALKLDSSVKVSSPIALTALQVTYPSSSGVFRSELAVPVMSPMLELLRRSNSSLMVNAYPFFAYAADSESISLDYALSKNNSGVADPGTGVRYFSLLDAQIDAVFAAMAAMGYRDVGIVVTETGWPSRGDANETAASPENAAEYNGNLVRRALSGGRFATPSRPGRDIDVYLFALFNEDKKPGAMSERNYGLFYPDESKVYEVNFTGGDVGDEEHKKKKMSRWCVADPAAGEEKLQIALDFACGEGGADCSEILPGAACYLPDTVAAHASFAFNGYFQRMGRAAGSCHFGGAAMIVDSKLPPKIGKCLLPSTD